MIIHSKNDHGEVVHKIQLSTTHAIEYRDNPPKIQKTELFPQKIQGGPVQYFHMDFGFMQGSNYKLKSD